MSVRYDSSARGGRKPSARSHTKRPGHSPHHGGGHPGLSTTSRGHSLSRMLAEPNMSDSMLLVTIEDIINNAFNIGFKEGETRFSVNFSKIQSVLMILSSSMRLLERKVDVHLPPAGALARYEEFYESFITKRPAARKKAAPGPPPGPSVTRAGSRVRIGSIEVVTQEQYRVLEEKIQVLTDLARTPPPLPNIPGNKELLQNIMNGDISVPELLQNLQICSRMAAAEAAIIQLSELIGDLEGSGALPGGLAARLETLHDQIDAINADHEEAGTLFQGTQGLEEEDRDTETTGEDGAGRQPSPQGYSLGIDMSVIDAIRDLREMYRNWKEMAARPVVLKPPEPVAKPKKYYQRKVTHEEMVQATDRMRVDVDAALQTAAEDAFAIADSAIVIAQAVEEKMNTALGLDLRLSKLMSVVKEHAQQLVGLDKATAMQIDTFQEQVTLLRVELEGGLMEFEKFNFRSEAVAVLELKERYEAAVQDLENTVLEHMKLSQRQERVQREVKDLAEAIEHLRDQKADREEVTDGLRDKANVAQLIRMVREAVFEDVRVELQLRIQMGYEKLRRMDSVWMEAVNDFSIVTTHKAAVTDLMNLRVELSKRLKVMERKVRLLARVLGEPKAALITRKLDAACAACAVPARLDAAGATRADPRALPALRRKPPQPTTELCLKDLIENDPDELRKHVCHRWAGGSHTAMPRLRTQLLPAVAAAAARERRYRAAAGDDGQVYHLSEPMQPCEACIPQEPEYDEEEPEDVEAVEVEEESSSEGNVDVVGPRMRLHTFSPGKLLRKTIIAKYDI